MKNRLLEPEREIQPQPVTWATDPEDAWTCASNAGDRLTEAILRAHLVEAEGRSGDQRQAAPDQVHGWNVRLVFDTETTTDEFATLRFGTYIVEQDSPLTHEIERLQAGFFTGESLGRDEAQQIEDYCTAHELTCMTRREWLDRVLFRYGYKERGAVVGFNLPFDLSRIATRSGVIRKTQEPAKDPAKKNWINDLFAGGFMFRFNEYEKKAQPGQWRERAWRPGVMMKPITPRACMYRWSFFKGWQEKGDRLYPGHFLDLRTLGCALSGKDNGSLRSFGELFGASVKKSESHEHGNKLTGPYLDYAMNDAEATLSLYYAEMVEYKKHGLSLMPDRIYSGAGLGKAYLQDMGISGPPNLDTGSTGYSRDEILGFAFSSYFAARSEAQVVRLPVPVTYVDFHSMYPAVCIRQGLWDFMKAEKVLVSDATGEAVEFLNTVEREDLFDPGTWKKLPVLCLVEPLEDMLPVRLPVQSKKSNPLSYQNTLALVTSSSAPVWYTLADCLASKLATGKPPHILKALKFSPEGSKPLKPVSIHGGEKIEAGQEDFFRALVEARDSLGKEQPKLAQGLKIVANSTSYGIWVEIDIEDGERPVTAYGTETRRAIIPHGEKPGRYYFPPLAALITSAGRLMLSLLEGEIRLRGGLSAFCDTDSLAIVSSEKGGAVHYRDHRQKDHQIPALAWSEVDEALDRFKSLNPYRSGKALIKLEKENFEDQDPAKPRLDLYAYAIAVKRNCLYRPLPDGTVQIVKPSYHTLGIVEPPHEIVDGGSVKVAGWIEDLWRSIVTGQDFSPPWLWQPVEFHMDITRPEIWKSFRKIRNEDRILTGNKWMDKFLSGVKPFNFLAVLAKAAGNPVGAQSESEELKGVPVIAPLGSEGQTDPRRWLSKNSGKPVHALSPKLPGEGAEDAAFVAHGEDITDYESLGWLCMTPMPFKELLVDYCRHHESKAVDCYGGETDRSTLGKLTHPRVQITGLVFTGKESVLQEEAELGLVSREELENSRFMIAPGDRLMQALSFLSKAELGLLEIGWYKVEKIKDETGVDHSLLINDPEVRPRLIAYLRGKYALDVGDAADQDVLRVFVESRKNLLKQWEALRPRLSSVPTKELAHNAGCSEREARRIKYRRVEPGVELIRKIVTAFPA